MPNIAITFLSPTLQKLMSWNPFKRLFTKLIDTPTETDLRQWASSHWIEYQAWLFHHSFITLREWQQLRTTAKHWHYQPLISIVTPVYNTPLHYLQACLYSVQTQAYPHWEMCLVDDGSTHPETLDYLQQVTQHDPRLHLHTFSENQGICRATNHAITMATGEFVAFLDHDDRLAPDALYWIVAVLQTEPRADILYSDRDMLSSQDLRYMHLFKPGWSPETLLSGNYLFHLLVYRRSLLTKLGGIQEDMEGSQDYDLILRAAELNPRVKHIPKVLYHWRQHQNSVSFAQDAKEYAYAAGVQALKNALQRRGLPGSINENKTLWRGNYRVQLEPLPREQYHILQLATLEHYAQHINQTFQQFPYITALVVLTVTPLEESAIAELTSWLQIPQVGFVTGKVLNPENCLLHAGLVLRTQGIPLAVYTPFPESIAGYMAVTSIVRNVSVPHPGCCVIKREVWEQLQGLDENYTEAYGLLDFALRSATHDFRTVYTPFARFTAAASWQTPEQWSMTDNALFTKTWSEYLQQGDPYYNPHLTLALADMGLNLNDYFCYGAAQLQAVKN
jgi:glycosyltransferase involved in cell wall biosynthesis